MADIDYFLPQFDFNETHSRQIAGSPQEIYDALQELRYSDSLFIRYLFRLRGLTIGTFRDSLKTFTVLSDKAEEIVLGLIGRPWKITGELKPVSREEFLEFREPNNAKMVWNFTFQPNEEGTWVTTETRILCPDQASRRKFGIYWFFVRPFSGLVRIEILRLLAHSVEGKHARH